MLNISFLHVSFSSVDLMTSFVGFTADGNIFSEELCMAVQIIKSHKVAGFFGLEGAS